MKVAHKLAGSKCFLEMIMAYLFVSNFQAQAFREDLNQHILPAVILKGKKRDYLELGKKKHTGNKIFLDILF